MRRYIPLVRSAAISGQPSGFSWRLTGSAAERWKSHAFRMGRVLHYPATGAVERRTALLVNAHWSRHLENLRRSGALQCWSRALSVSLLIS